MRRMALAVVGAILFGACSAGPSGGAGSARAVPLGGIVEVGHDGAWRALESPSDLEPGDLLRSGGSGRARLFLGTEASVEIGPDSSLRLDGQTRAEVLGGQALAEGAPGAVALAVNDSVVQPSGGAASFRVDRSLSARVGVYRGAVDVRSDGRPVLIDALWQAVVAAGVVTQSPEPLTVSPADPWDVRLLGQPIDVGDQLTRLGRGVKSQLAGRGAPAPLLADAFPGGLSTGGVRRLLSGHGLDDVFLALAVAHRAETVPEETPVTGVAGQVLDLRDLGASWAIVVAAFAVLESPLLTLIAQVLAAIPQLFEAPSFGVAGGPEPAGDTSPSTGGSGGTTTEPTDTSGSGTTDTGGSNDATILEPPAPSVSTCDATQVGCLVDDIIDGLVGGRG